MAKSTKTYLDKQALDLIKVGVNEIYEPVRRTLGPECGTTLMYRTYNRGPRNVDDGYYTAEVITPKNVAIRLASDFFKEGIKKTNEKVGDSTTTTCVIGGKLFNECYDKMHAKVLGYKTQLNSSAGSPMLLKREILSEAKMIKEKVRSVSTPIASLEDLEKIAVISLGDNEELAKQIAKMSYELGIENSIDVVEGYKGEVEIETTKGFKFPAKICGKAFVNKAERFEMVVENSPVLVTNYKIDSDAQIRHLLSKFNSAKVTLIAPDFSDDILINMVISRQEGVFIWPIKVPSLREDQFEDLATFCGAKFINKRAGDKIERVDEADMGFLEKIIVKDIEAKEDAVIIGGRGEGSERLKDHIKKLESQKVETQQEQFKKLLDRRIASMASAVGVIRVGSPTDAETLPLKLKIEDVVYACKAALRGGYVKGGGLCLKEIAQDLPDGHILKNAILAPYLQIQENAGRILEIGDDVIDPTDAVYYAVEHATSVVASLITVKNLIPEMEDPISGEGEYAIARALTEFVISNKIHLGQIQENQREEERDRMGGLTVDEKLTLDNG